MKIWKNDFTLEGLNNGGKNCMVEHLGIEIIDFGDDYLTAKMPVDARTKQPMGLLHGGASVALAESLGSFASVLCVDMSKQTVVGLEINANHLKSASSGYVYGTCKPVRVGRTVHVWNIEVKNEKEDLVCVSRLTVAVIDRRD